MLSVVCVEPGMLALENRIEPKLTSGQVKVKIRRIGLCGTDFHIFSGMHPFLEYPRVMGHEVSGEVYEISNNSTLRIGDRVILNPYIPCGQCIACRREKPNCCSDISVLGVHSDGGMSEFITVPESSLYSAQGLSLDECAMVEFLAVGAHAVSRGKVKSNDRVLIVGTGPIGLGTALFSSIANANVTLLDVSADRVTRAEALVPGAQGFVVSDSVMQQLLEHTDSELFDVVLDATGNKHAMESSIQYVAHGGTCVYVSVGKGDIVFSDPLFHSREMSLVGSRNATQDDFEKVINAIRNDQIPTEKLNTHKTPLHKLPEIFASWHDDRDQMIKAIVHI